MDDNLYDEFGNYIGPELSENADYDNEDRVEIDEDELDRDNMEEEEEENAKEDQIVLYEDKKYYPDADEVYPGVETMIQEEDTQAIHEPIIGVERTKDFDVTERNLPETTFNYEFMQFVMKNPELIRNVAVVGHLHHGKTLLMDMFVKQTHGQDWFIDKEYKYTDTRADEQDRKISIKATPMSLILPDSRDKSYLINLFDTPGHPNFSDEMCSAVRACDGALLVVDVIEGVMLGTEEIIKHLVQENIAITVVLNKIDRLILEMRLPPQDAYLKIRHTLEEVNGIIAQHSSHLADSDKYKISPALGNVAFASTEYGFCFTLKSFAKNYTASFPKVNPEDFARVLWGDYYFNAQTRKFMTMPTKEFNDRTFVHFILEPIYKIFSHTVSKEYDKLSPVLAKLGVFIRKEDYKRDTKDLLKIVTQTFFGNTSSVVDMIAKFIPTARAGTPDKVRLYYTGKENQELMQRMSKCDPEEILIVHIVKMYNKPDCQSFDAFGRVISGTLTKKHAVKIMGENYTKDDEEDMAVRNITNLYIYQGRYKVEVDSVSAGNWVLIEGIDQSISKTATVTLAQSQEDVEIFRPIRFNTTPHVKLAIESLIPSELPKMLEGLRKVNKSYPILVTKVEESGEHLLIGTGELYMDCVMHDLRLMYSEIEIKVSDPVVTFCETVIESSSIKCYVESHNKKNRLTALAEPMDKGLADDIEKEKIDLTWAKPTVSKFFTDKYDWDILAARSIWAFGPEKFGPNALVDFTLPSETDTELLTEVKESVIQGFRWATKEGPLCDEPIRNVKFKLLDAQISGDPLYRAGGQIIPAARRVCYSSFLMATPRVMEPTLLTEIQCTADALGAISAVLSRRRGHMISELPKPGSPLYTVRANIPAIDSFGFETDLRIHTTSQAFCLSVFDYWSVLPGDPLDRSIVLRPLEPSAPAHLAREFMVRTRRRKGLSEDVSIIKYFDDPILLETLRGDTDYKNLL